ncbi:hypothetical protein ABGB18_19660 [Nonomuraea sp. B12E4]|uniref:hypothetical protein n=1 Tax=Nonomuraea sp. B12E4 TaxID=3153564 RepID=UPI00325C6F53
MIIGEAAMPEIQRAIEDVLRDDAAIGHFTRLRTLHLGPAELLVAARVTMADPSGAGQVAEALHETEQCIRERVPLATVVYLQPGSRGSSE